MLDKLTSTLDFQARALVLRADRQQLIAANIANADTPGYAGKDMDFARALRDASAGTARTGKVHVLACIAGRVCVGDV
ncbi:MAG: flagellar basal body rod protein FlgB, partial [Comamonadaceae bacterium]